MHPERRARRKVAAASRWLAVALLLCGCVAAGSAAAADVCAQVVSFQGSVEIQRSGQGGWQRVERLDTRLCEGERLRVGPLSRAALLVGTGALVRVDQNTVMGLRLTAEETLVELDSGAVYSISRFPRRYRIRSPFVNANVEGTEFLVSLGAAHAEVAVFEGRVATEDLVGNAPGSRAVLAQGQVARFARGTAPAIQAMVNPTDAVQWALYYPALDRGGDKASELLRVGRAEEAERELQAAGSQADALALRSVIRLTKNDKEGALRLAQQAVAANAASVRALLAESYAKQADFRLDEALAAASRAVQLEPSNSIARARQAELLLSMGRLKEAETAANEAVNANPADSRAQTILGFAQLARLNTAGARQRLEQALAADPADPLPRLGLGLAAIKEGRTAEGREDIEIAVTLDPQNALLRSYLGKAYSDERRDALASDQFARAKELDARDPTPWFYDAIRLQALNRPGEALQELHESIERNDNRAVYRSRLLLDEDQAARSASRARIYSDLGFDELAVREAKSALATDPGSFAAHRFLAEAYLPLPGFDIARISEVLQSQLLQPVNAAALPPQLQQIRSPLLLGSGPITPSFQEFNPLFARDRHSLSVSGSAGSADTRADEIIYGYYGGRRSFQLGQSHYDTDGFRTNADLRQDFLRAFYQEDLDPQTSFQAELSRSATLSGDTRLQFEPGSFSPNQRNRAYVSTARLGARHAFDPGSMLIGSFIAQRQNARFNDAIIDPFFEVDFESATQQRSYNGELQYQGRGGWGDVVAGAGAFQRRETGDFTATLLLPPLPPDVQVTPVDASLRSRNAYAYGYLGRRYKLVLGASVDHVENPDPLSGREDTQFSPKLGAILPLGAATSARFAAVRGIKRLPSANPSIEPTQVAGFNQVFDDLTHTRFWLYGAAIDHSWSSRQKGGVEITQRDIEAPLVSAFPVEHRRGWLHRAYFSRLLTDRLGLGAELRLEKLGRELTIPTGPLFQPTDMDTRALPLTATYHSPSGLFTRARLTFVDQEIESRNDFGDRERSRDGFKVFDLSVGARLPRRHGIVSLDALNLFNERFTYRDPIFEGFVRVPQYAPVRAVYVRVQLTL